MDPPPVQYVTTSDGVNIAYTSNGTGQPFVFVPNLMNHVRLSWEYPGLREWLPGLSERFKLVRYDSRGTGMSTRGLREDHSFDDYQIDLEAVLERLQLNHFVLCGNGPGNQIAARYAALHPDRITAFVIVGSVSIGGLRAGDLLYRTLPEQDWEMFLQSVASSNIASTLDMPRTVEMLRQSVTQDEWLNRNRGLKGDLEDVLSQLRTPTLVLHPHEFAGLSIEASMKVAQLTKGQLVVIDGVGFLGDATQGIRAIESFLAELAEATPAGANTSESPGGLSSREIEVLLLIATGRSNQQIADELVISVNTVGRHVGNILNKTGAANRAEAASYAHLHGLV